MRWRHFFGPVLVLTMIAGCTTPPTKTENPPVAPASAVAAPNPSASTTTASATDGPGASSIAPAAPAVTSPATAGAGSGQSGPNGARAVNSDTHIDVIRADGPARPLWPPQSLHLTAGPVWSPDGEWVAVLSGTDFTWMVEVATNRWVYVGHALSDPKLTKWDDRWTAWWAEISARPMRKWSGQNLTQVRQGPQLQIYVPTHVPKGLKLAYIESGTGSEWAFIGFVDASGKEVLTITERTVSGMSPGWIPHQYIDLPLEKDGSGKTAAHVGCRNQGECTVAWTAPDPYIQVEVGFPFAMTQADLLTVIASLSPTATEEQITDDLLPLGHIAP